MTRYIITIIAAIGIAIVLLFAVKADIEQMQGDYVRAVRGPK